MLRVARANDRRVLARMSLYVTQNQRCLSSCRPGTTCRQGATGQVWPCARSRSSQARQKRGRGRFQGERVCCGLGESVCKSRDETNSGVASLPRQKRVDEAGVIRHALNCIHRRQAIFHQDEDYEAFLRILKEQLEK